LKYDVIRQIDIVADELNAAELTANSRGVGKHVANIINGKKQECCPQGLDSIAAFPSGEIWWRWSKAQPRERNRLP
jgi:hypothetical protein